MAPVAQSGGTDGDAAAAGPRKTVRLVLEGMREEIGVVELEIAEERARSQLVVERLLAKIDTLEEQLKKWDGEGA